MTTDNSCPQADNQDFADELIAQKDLDDLAALDELDYAAVRKQCAKTIRISVTLLDKIRKDHKRRLKEKAKEERKKQPLKGKNGKSVIAVDGGSLSDNATDAENRLMQEGVQIYQRAAKLLRPTTEEVPSARRGKKTKTAALLPVTEAYMRDMLCQHIDWMRFDARKEEWVTINPSRDVVQIIMARAGDWKFNPVIGITSTPTMRYDGSILTEEGYDEQTGLILLNPPKLPEIPKRPSRIDALYALNLLKDLIAEYPYVDETSRAVALSALITPAVRAALSAAPMHCFNAPAAGTGKSHNIDLVSTTYSGVPCPVIGKGDSLGELEKRVNTSLMAGHPMFSIDNVNGDLGGDWLCQAIERPIADIRILGHSRHQRIQNTVTIFANGNNLRLVGDVVRRSLMCNLDAKMERPELREFKNDPIKMALADRGKYIAAALIIVRAYLVAGSPSPGSSMQVASFQEWSDLVRSSLIWLDCADPIKSMDKARSLDPELEVLTNLLRAISDEIGTGEVNAKTAADIISIGYPDDIRNLKHVREPEDMLLQEALSNLPNKPKHTRKVDSVTLGHYFGKHKDRQVSGLKLIRIDKGKRGAKWYVEKV